METEDWGNTIVLGDLNISYSKPKDERADQIVETLLTDELHDLSKHFKQKGTKQNYGWTWQTFREDKPVTSICDYILTGTKLKWRNFKVVDTLIDTDH